MSTEYTVIGHHTGHNVARETHTWTIHDPASDELRAGMARFFSAEGFNFPSDEEVEADLLAAHESRNRAIELLNECTAYLDSAKMSGRINAYLAAVDAEHTN